MDLNQIFVLTDVMTAREPLTLDDVVKRTGKALPAPYSNKYAVNAAVASLIFTGYMRTVKEKKRRVLKTTMLGETTARQLLAPLKKLAGSIEFGTPLVAGKKLVPMPKVDPYEIETCGHEFAGLTCVRAPKHSGYHSDSAGPGGSVWSQQVGDAPKAEKPDEEEE